MDYTEQRVNDIIDGEVRSGFVQKVYGILSVQLVITALIASPIATQDPHWVAQNMRACQACMIVSLVAVISVSCCFKSIARKVPYNYAFLLLVTVCEAVMVGFVCAMYKADSVLFALLQTAGIFFGLTLYACTTKSDFTGCGPYLATAMWGLLLTSIMAFFLPGDPLRYMISGFGAILFSFYIVYDTQMICGGKHKVGAYGVDDYVFAALNIYLDIINLFLYLLELFGDRK